MPGTDGRRHLVYEYELTNTKAAPATIKRVDILDAVAPGRVLASWSGKALVARLRTLIPSPATSAVISADVSRLLFVELSFPSKAAVPAAVTMRLHLLAAANPGATTPTRMHYTAGRVTISRARLPVIGPPLAGTGWVGDQRVLQQPDYPPRVVREPRRSLHQLAAIRHRLHAPERAR